MSTIGVIVPVYKVEKYICRCIDSILSQSYKDFRLILIDDCSPDKCGEICDSYAEHDSRIVAIHHQQNGGLSAARNSGLDWICATGCCEWVTFIDSDDWVHPQYLEVLIEAATAHHCEIVVGQFFPVERFSVGFERIDHIDDREMATEDFFTDNSLYPISACGRLFSVKLFRSIRFPVGRIHEDRFTTYKVLFMCPTVVYINHPLYYCYLNPDSITRTTWTLKRLDDVIAIEQQLKYFVHSHYTGVYLYLLKDYGTLLVYSLKHLNKNGYGFWKKTRIRNKLRWFIMFSMKKLDYTNDKRQEMRKYAYPVVHKMYYRLCKK